MYIRGKLDAFPKGSLLTIYSQDLAIFLMDHNVLPIKQEDGMYYYVKNKKVKKIVKDFSKKGGSIL